ncbi:hypothetical protein [Pseudomonas proteolytica]|uniref:hypothetical protein n=1 Tax=Pseudomonas proteolytica TaxID=219574 RepID=UPI001F33A2F4|nr:hypothetical protein [Pseudomonas proteolytica]
MNPTAFKALADALDRQFQTPKPASKLLPPILANEPLPELVITGPINRVMELEGKRYALEFVRALGASIRREPIRTKAIADLTRYAVAHPSSVASGIKQVIDMLREA